MRSSKSYRRPRRPPATLRTKDGCLTCLQRKKKCDGRKDQCNNCHRIGRQCNWRPERQRTLSDSVAFTEIHTLKPGVRGLPASVRASDPEPCGLFPVLPAEWSPQCWEIFRHYVNNYLPQLFRTSRDHAHSKAVKEQLLDRARKNQYMMNTLLAQAALHLAASNESYRVFALGYYVQAVSGLRGYLEANSVGFDETNVSLAALGLCIFESHVQQPHISENVAIHVNWVAKVIRQRVMEGSGYYNLLRSDAEVALQRLILESFLFHASRIPLLHENCILSADVEAAISTAAHICESEAGRGASPWDHSPLLGVSPKVFILIHQLSCLARTSLGNRKHNLEQSEVDHATQLLQQLKESEFRYQDNVETKGIQILTLACQSLISSFQGEDYSSDFKVTKMVARQAISSIDLSALPTTYHREFYRWPMSVLQDFIGVEQVYNFNG